MTPLIIPEYQHIFSSLCVKINYFPRSLYIPGNKNTITALIIGIASRVKKAIRTASHFPSTLSTEAPR